MKLRTKAKIRAKPGKLVAVAGSVGLAIGAGLGVLAVKKGPDVIKLAAERLSGAGDGR